MMHAEDLVHCDGLQDLLGVAFVHTGHSILQTSQSACSAGAAAVEAATPLTKIQKMQLEPK